MLLRVSPTVLVCWLAMTAMPSHNSDLKIVHRFTWNDHSHTTTKYISGERSRVEFPPSSAGWAAKPGDPITYTYGHRRATIYQCDQRRVYEVDLDAREYTSYKLNELGLPAGVKPRRVEPSGATLTVTVETIDTGQRKEIFGFTGRHLVMRVKQVAGPGGVSQSSESEQDGWYIDLDVNDGCLRVPWKKRGIGVVAGTAVAPREKIKSDTIVVNQVGVSVGEVGFPIEVTSRNRALLPDGTPGPWTEGAKTEVVELSTGPLDPALFEVPAGFKKVRKLKDKPPVPPSLRHQATWNRLKQSLLAMFR